MSTHRLAWLASLALMTVGGVVAHAVAYRLVTPAVHHHQGHGGGFAHLNLCLALCSTILLVAVGLVCATHLLRLRALHLPLWLFALLPPVGFTIQEHLERFLHTGSAPFGISLEAVFLVGIVLQLPFALAAYVAARALVSLAVAVAATLRAPYRPPRVSLALTAPVSLGLSVPRERVLAGGLGGRAPPVVAVG